MLRAAIFGMLLPWLLLVLLHWALVLGLLLLCGAAVLGLLHRASLLDRLLWLLLLLIVLFGWTWHKLFLLMLIILHVSQVVLDDVLPRPPCRSWSSGTRFRCCRSCSRCAAAEGWQHDVRLHVVQPVGNGEGRVIDGKQQNIPHCFCVKTFEHNRRRDSLA